MTSFLLIAKSRANLRPAYIRSLRQYMAQFSRRFGCLPIAAITPTDLDRWFSERREQPATEASNRGRLSALFSFAVRRGWRRDNPVLMLEPIRLEPRPPVILTPGQARRIREYTESRRPHRLAWLALALYAGIRPDEACRLSWASVSTDCKIVTVDAAASKVRRRRVVHLHPSASDLLLRCRGAQAPLPVSVVARKRFLRDLRALLSWEAWPKDILRHTCASYWLASTQDPARVAFWLGNSPGILLRHYHEIASPEDAACFWDSALDPNLS